METVPKQSVGIYSQIMTYVYTQRISATKNYTAIGRGRLSHPPDSGSATVHAVTSVNHLHTLLA